MYLFVALNILDDTYCGGTGSCGGTCEDEATDVGDDFDDDEPPGIVDFDFGIGGFDGVVGDALNLFGSEFDFHEKYAFVFECKDISKKMMHEELCINFFSKR